MKRIRQKLRGWKLFTLIGVLAALAIAVAQPMVRQAQSGSAGAESLAPGAESLAPGTIILPSTRITVDKATVVTPQEIAQADAAIAAAPSLTREKPFMPTNPIAYAAAKNQANAAAAPAMGKPGTAPTSSPEALVPPTLRGVSYDGLNQSLSGGSYPPDTHGAVGPSHYVQVVNTRMSAFNKAQPGAQLCTFTLAALHGAAEFIFDPRVVYDQTWNRWVFVASRASSSTTDTIRRFYLAVSTSGNPCGSYFRYTVNFGGGSFNAGDWWDYPGLGMNQDAVLITGNIFDTPAGGFRFPAMMPIAKARIYNGLGFSVPVFTTGLAPTLQPPIVLDQNKDAYFVAANNGIYLHLYRGEKLSNAYEATMTFQGFVNVVDYAVPPDARQVGTAIRLDSLDRRFVNASTQTGDSLFNVHTIALGSFPAPRWYEIDTEGAGANTVKQQGFFFESPTSDDWNASIAANASREVFVTWNSTDVLHATTSVRHQARVRISGRLAADPLNVIGAGYNIFTSAVPLTGNGGSVQRWGDYSAVSLDPSTAAGCSSNRRAWLSNEKIQSASVWGSRIARFGFCG